ncbi:hypothetical protein ACFVJ9_47315, partial [Streptomyces sp. NPDC127574]
WRPLQRFLGRREHYPATHRAVAGLVSDRAAQRPTRRKPSTELVPQPDHLLTHPPAELSGHPASTSIADILTVGLGTELATRLPQGRLRAVPHLRATQRDLGELLLAHH